MRGQAPRGGLRGRGQGRVRQPLVDGCGRGPGGENEGGTARKRSVALRRARAGEPPSGRVSCVLWLVSTLRPRRRAGPGRAESVRGPRCERPGGRLRASIPTAGALPSGRRAGLSRLWPGSHGRRMLDKRPGKLGLGAKSVGCGASDHCAMGAASATDFDRSVSATHQPGCACAPFACRPGPRRTRTYSLLSYILPPGPSLPPSRPLPPSLP